MRMRYGNFPLVNGIAKILKHTASLQQGGLCQLCGQSFACCFESCVHIELATWSKFLRVVSTFQSGSNLYGGLWDASKWSNNEIKLELTGQRDQQTRYVIGL